MTEKTKEQLWADWVASQSGNFQELLNGATEEGKYKILAQLLSKELEKSKKGPQH